MRAFGTLVGDEQTVGRALHYLNAFRLLVSFAALGAVFGPPASELEGYRLFLAQAAALTYAVGAVGFMVLHLRRRMEVAELASFSLASDLILIGLILHAFGGIESALVILLLFTVGITGLILDARTTLLFASLVTLGLLLDAWLNHRGSLEASSLFQAALYGAGAFGIAVGASLLGRWGREYKLLAERRGLDLANLGHINELIIHKLRSGVLVVDSHNRIRQMNEAAWYLLGNPPVSDRNLRSIAPPLADRLERWRKTGKVMDEGLLLQSTQSAVVPTMLTMPGVDDSEATLIFLEDTSVLTRRARDLAQASLARLSASIAHEIRNPLGALSHAAQLLNESEDLNKADRKLLGMMLNHATRMNDIVENVLKLSRRERARIESVNLISWIRKLASDFRRYHKLDAGRVKLEIPSASIMVMIDSSQLNQAVWNLMDNALKHASVDGQEVVITLRVSPIRGHREIALDIIDNGPGIPLEKRSQVFEPFFTTHKQGSGLGLYLARQLCDANQAPLEYVQVPNRGACFRILLRRPESGEMTENRDSQPARAKRATG
ncbi:MULTISPECIES: nitrogen regulation protein NR(II) [unclassified Wenzhouxiangella]|uniref:two-component system sensor histidine kinase NtrB n=1 Tax=unclassified Wenzhouxiangella TaxID=2613841 RepID=UPI000E32760F|nr:MULTISPECIES: ATP-binding protein [unclassified Wenzhouxiangella]RFF28260.1 two-component sensor histidine kinase [Wenzhouxiangella sp. 15181]RFP69382.1 two-component sensor histidine kinase [Wenzhouxiangella sp. 15190]